MDNEFSILDDYWMQMFMINLKASDALYHLLGGKESHKVVRCQHRCNGWGWGDEYGEIISHEMLAKDQFGLNHAMTIRFIDDLSELEDIKEHPMRKIWEYQENGKDYFCRPATHMMVYFVNDTLPEDKLVCRMRYLIDNYIAAEDSQKIGMLDDFTLLDFILSQESKLDNEDDTAGQESAAESIENNIRKKVVERMVINPA